jgi:hypothetical protein
MLLVGSCGGIFERMTDEKLVIGNTTTSPAAIFPAVFAESARPLNNSHLKLGSSDSQSVSTTFVNAGDLSNPGSPPPSAWSHFAESPS